MNTVSDQKVHIISSTAVEPSSPTPHRLRTLNLSLLDQLFPTPLAHTLLFYAGCGGGGGGGSSSNESLSRRMRASLSQALTDFYPLAGRLTSSARIDCNDEGAYWVEARADLRLADVLARPDGTLLSQFLPSSHPETSPLAAMGCLLTVQITTFSCGGVAVATCSSHKLMDASSMAFFLRSWSARCAGRLEGGRAPPPRFLGDSLVRAKELPFMLSDYAGMESCATRRFVFEGSKISALKAEAVRSAKSGESTRFTRVELVLSLIVRCALAASRSVTGSSHHPTLLRQMVNLRNRMSPALRENDVGNLAFGINILCENGESTFEELLSNIRKEMVSFTKGAEASGSDSGELFSIACGSIGKAGDFFSKWKEESRFYRCSSLCGFRFYDVDFGSGKPAWVTCLSRMKNFVYMVDAKGGGGIDAWVTLDWRDMAVFERDEELLAYAAPNPSVAHRVMHPSRF
ncbi:acyltransferase Pun1-like [Rhodamnia argentea]|uniref:Acyltransferase Pun1-like n=1 Tax=Rhodamnia argentea TaxID=178133 RepID=A0A8B8N5K3_9MYRT|nr:acyltransferase Pun1-like [Rhodamnia argentea]